MLKRPSNRPRDEIVRLAQQAIREHGGPERARVFYKFDCAACGSREMTPDPNVLPETGTCSVCGAVTPILGAGYALHIRRAHDVPWDTPAVLIRKPYQSDQGDA